MDKFADMEMFVAIVHHRGMASAGRALGLSPATVTARLQNLEQRYGVKLLNRSTRHLSLTDAGALYHQSCIEILESVRATENVLQTGTTEVKGPLKISAPKDIGKQYIAPLLSSFCRKYPDVIPFLYLNDGLSNMAESGLDLVIRYGELADSQLISRKLATSQRVLCASPQYLADYEEPESPTELMAHQCLALIRGNEALQHWYFAANGEQQSISIMPKRYSDDGEVLRQWAIDGEGIVMKSILDVQQDIAQGRLVTLLDGYTKNFSQVSVGQSADLHVIYQSRDYLPKRMRLFLDHLYTAFDAKKNGL
ncbi:LysR family transcriptional regulator [Vibrio variabilis]|uniref:LysR family transcriptional regulator n=1 Tax=Vibrio variabilis TaxID=990271 RepID=A0ABR4YF90_9VIBR|nr:LysR family transcriptional regulator [Vibrio variabilis]KHA62161.1 LysR family transcriptional regulator [Vibrio variabilis]